MKEQAKNQDKKVCPYLREEISPYLLCYNKFCYEDPRNLVRHIAISDTIQTVKNATEFELLTYHKILMEDEVERILGETECEVYFSGKGFYRFVNKLKKLFRPGKFWKSVEVKSYPGY